MRDRRRRARGVQAEKQQRYLHLGPLQVATLRPSRSADHAGWHAVAVAIEGDHRCARDHPLNLQRRRERDAGKASNCSWAASRAIVSFRRLR